MARILGAIFTSHIPAIGGAIARGAQQEPYWKPFFDGYPPVREWLDKVSPDLVVVVYNDHGLNFFLDKLPTFAIGAAAEYRNDDEGWGLPTLPPFPGDPPFSWHVIESLVADEFDVTTCQEMLVDHAFTVPVSLLWPNRSARRFRTLPVAVNTVQHPLPTPARCYKLGHAIGRAIESYPEDLGVVVVATGGLSHQLDGERAGFINKPFDLMCLDKIVDDPQALASLSIRELVRDAGTQGVELIMWLVARGALTGTVSRLHSHYHIPVSNTAAGLLLLDNAA
ncbi:MAG TPA: class III extradiol dioxygenase family protein [Gammaproteobacteria bacterium]|nr:class III extradiol dioxygenase family protein [Gammaproteobacteria bacterium]